MIHILLPVDNMYLELQELEQNSNRSLTADMHLCTDLSEGSKKEIKTMFLRYRSVFICITILKYFLKFTTLTLIST